MVKIDNRKRISVIIAAGGSAGRFGQKDLISKQFLLLDGKPFLFHSIEKFLSLKNVFEIIVVTNDLNSTNKLLKEANYSDDMKFKTVEGSVLRQDSVYNGFCKVDSSVDLVVVHDVARPLFKIEDLEKCIEASSVSGAAILAVPVVDTIKHAISDKDRLLVKNTVDRQNLYLIQTPQVFNYNLLSQAYKKFKDSNQIVTDEANMLEILGEKVELIPGDRTNIKITYPEDLKIAEGILKGASVKNSKITRHCEERSDEAISKALKS